MNVLAGDVGGSNARLALAELADGRVTIRQQRTYHSRDYPGLAPIVRSFFEEIGGRPERACIGIACPIGEEVCRAPNLPWTVDTRAFPAQIGIASTVLINDFTAVGYGVTLLQGPDVETLQQGQPVARGAIALIGAGTGLGEGFLTWRGDRYVVHASEGGHGSFAPRGELQAGLARFLEREYGRVSWERAVSGPGITQTYRFLVTTGIAPESPGVRRELEQEEPPAVIVRHGLDGSDVLCRYALDLFVEAFGAAAGDLALTVLARGGVYVAGGIARRIVPRLREGGFLRAFRDKGRMSDLLTRIPLHVVVNPQVGLLGAAVVAGTLTDGVRD